MSSTSAFMRGEPTSAASRRSTADASACFSCTGFATHLGPRSSRLKEPERRRHGTSAFFRAASTGFQESREATSTVPTGLGSISTLPSTPPAAPCWAKLFRAYGAGFSATIFHWQLPSFVLTHSEGLLYPYKPDTP